MRYACLLHFKSTLPLVRLFIFLEFQIPKGVRQKGKGLCFPRITAYVLSHTKPPTFHTTNMQQVEKKGREPDSILDYTQCYSSITASLFYSILQIPPASSFPSCCLSPTLPRSLPPSLLTEHSSQHLHSSQPAPQQSDTATCASPVGWWMKSIASYVM